MIFTKKCCWRSVDKSLVQTIFLSKMLTIPVFKYSDFAAGYYVDRSVGSRSSPFTTVPCKTCNFAKKETSFQDLLIFLVSTNDS